MEELFGGSCYSGAAIRGLLSGLPQFLVFRIFGILGILGIRQLSPQHRYIVYIGRYTYE